MYSYSTDSNGGSTRNVPSIGAVDDQHMRDLYWDLVGMGSLTVNQTKQAAFLIMKHAALFKIHANNGLYKDRAVVKEWKNNICFKYAMPAVQRGYELW